MRTAIEPESEFEKSERDRAAQVKAVQDQHRAGTPTPADYAAAEEARHKQRVATAEHMSRIRGAAKPGDHTDDGTGTPAPEESGS